MIMNQPCQTHAYITQPSILNCSQRNAVTSASQYTSYGEVTQKLNISDIVLPVNHDKFYIASKPVCCAASASPLPAINDNNASIEFAYEQQRLQALGENIHKFNDTGPKSEVDPQDPRLGYLITRNKAVIENEEVEIENWANLVKVISITALGLSSLLILFGLVYACVIVIKVKIGLLLCIVPIGICITESTWMIYLALIGSRASALNDSESTLFTKFFKLTIGTIVGFLLQLGIMAIVKPIPEVFSSFENITNENETLRSEGYFSVGYCIVWGMCILDISLVGLAGSFCILLRRHLGLRATYVLQYNTLPLGYQIFSEFAKEKK